MGSVGSDGNIPVITVYGKTMPEAWEKSVVKTWKKGVEIATQYDKDGDPLSKDCTMIMVVQDPMAEPRIHRAFPGGLEDLEVYRQEVLLGIHDSWVDTSSRRVQAVTWQAWHDPGLKDPPCLQRIWVRMLKNTEGVYVLNMHTYWRSRDAFKAAFMNMFAMVSLQERIAGRVSDIIDKPVIVGQMVDISDSYHIYGSYWKEAGDAQSFQGFLKMMKARTFEERTWTMEFAEPFFEEARAKLAKERKE